MISEVICRANFCCHNKNCESKETNKKMKKTIYFTENKNNCKIKSVLSVSSVGDKTNEQSES